MPSSLFEPAVQTVFDQVRDRGTPPPILTSSPEDWRDKPIYFLMIDRFNNRLAPPVHAPFDDPNFVNFQGGTFRGVKEQLPYLKELGVGAIWISPALRNLKFETGTYHGYGIHDFLGAEPRFAEQPEHADDELRDLVDAAHQQGLYVVFDIVLNHAGNVFAYQCDADDHNCQIKGGAEAGFHSNAQPVLWRNANGSPRPDTTPIEQIPNPSRDAFAWPRELQSNDFFRRQGLPGSGDDTVGDFASLKQLRTDNQDLQHFLIRCYQYVIARFDVDGFRIDTLKYLKGDLARIFGNSAREFALSVGKKNFFTFGEVFDNEEKIARFIGRATEDRSELVGVDAALDFPLRFVLPGVIKGFIAPTALAGMYQHRKTVEQDVLSSHGDATRFFVTFLDNHDVKERIRYVDGNDPARFDSQVTLGLACLYSLQGIPCVYYGTEQGLHGRGTDEAVREALWGGPGFDRTNAFYKAIKTIAAVRASQPALRYGRQYFRPVSGDGQSYSVSPFPGGIVVFSRILNDQEIVFAANTNANQNTRVEIIIEQQLSQPGDRYRILYSNQTTPTAPEPVIRHPAGAVRVAELDGSTGFGPLHTLPVTLAPMEAQIIGR
jgi:glycosidase